MNKEKYQRFVELHKAGEPLLLGNAWNAVSARLLQEAGYKAIATSSVGVAESMGYRDGEEIGFDELLYIVKRICHSTDLPVTVDMERGYASDMDTLHRNIERLLELGVVGINIEDSVSADGQRSLVPVEVFAEKLRMVRKRLDAQGKLLFINARTDGYLLKLPEALTETLNRARAYAEAGASGIFVPFANSMEDVKRIVDTITLPVNLIAIPEIASNKELKELGVRRISMGGRFYKSVYSKALDILEEMKAE